MSTKWVIRRDYTMVEYRTRARGRSWAQLASFMHWPDQVKALLFDTKEDAEAFMVGLMISEPNQRDGTLKAVPAFGALLGVEYA